MKPNEIKKNAGVEVLVKWIMFTTSILGLALASAFYPVTANVIFIVIPSIAVLIFSKPVFFEKMKLSTLLTMRILIVIAALRIFNPQVYVDLVLLMLIVNILEATITDIKVYKKYYNGISGIFLALGVLALRGSWAYGSNAGNYYINFGAPGLENVQAAQLIIVLYAIAYTIWNWIFVTNEFSASVALMHVGFLLAPFLGAALTHPLGWFGGINLWLVLRANTLSIGGWMQICCKQWFEREFEYERFQKFVNWTKQKNMQIIFMIINIVLILICLIVAFKEGALFTYSFPSFKAPMM